jgi:hypothetical protein
MSIAGSASGDAWKMSRSKVGRDKLAPGCVDFERGQVSLGDWPRWQERRWGDTRGRQQEPLDLGKVMMEPPWTTNPR